MSIFSKKRWTNRISEYPDRRTLTYEDGSTKVVKVARNEGTVAQEGEAFNEANMNDLESRIDNAFTEGLGGNTFSFDGTNFFVTNGTKTKKLGSSDGNATPELVLEGVTYNSAYTKSNEDYSTGTMSDKRGLTVNAGTVTNDKGGVFANIPTRGCYDTESRLKVPQSAISNVYYLGTGTSFDIRSKFPNDYSRLTANNFLCVAKNISVSANGKGGYEIHGGSYASDDHIQYTSGSKTSNVSKSYSNGVLTIGGYNTSCSDNSTINSGSVTAYGELSASASITFDVYVVLGNIVTA